MGINKCDNEKAVQMQQIAFRLFLEKGYEATSIRAICKAAQIELPTLYYYFGSKKGLFFSVADALRGEYEQSCADNPVSTNATEPDDILYGLFAHGMHYAMNHLQETRFFLRFSLFPPEELKGEILAFLQETQRRKDEAVVPLMTECIRRGQVSVDLQQALPIFWKFYNNNTFDAVFSGWQPSEAELKELWAMFLKCRLRGAH